MGDRVGIHEVASAAGVSTTTVSHAMTGRGKVSPDTRERVRRIADELGYRPNRIATALRNRRTGVLGLVTDEVVTTPYAGRMVFGAQAQAAEHGLTLMITSSDGGVAAERRQIEALQAQQVDALLYATMFHRVVAVPDPALGMPLVLLNAQDARGAAPSVGPDERRAGAAATQVLLEAGHRRIAHLTLQDLRLAVDGRVDGHLAAMRQAGLPAHVVRVPGPGDAAAGRAALRRALEEQPDTTAVAVFNDEMAMGVYQAAAALGRTVPEQLSVIGVDDLEVVAAALQPGLTTMALPHEAMGRWAVDTAVALLDDGESATGRVLLEAPLVRRGSVVPPQRRAGGH